MTSKSPDVPSVPAHYLWQSAVHLAQRFPVNESDPQELANALVGEAVRLFAPHEQECEASLLRRHPEWEPARLQEEAVRRAVQGRQQTKNALFAMYCHACQEREGAPVFSLYMDMLTNGATEFQLPRHREEISRGEGVWLSLSQGFSRSNALSVLLEDRGAGGPAYDAAVRWLIEPIGIRFSAGNNDHQEARRRVRTMASEQEVPFAEVVSRIKITAAYNVLAEFDREFRKRFGKGEGYGEHTFTTDQLRWRDLVKLFDMETREAFFAILLDKNYPNQSHSDVLAGRVASLLDEQEDENNPLALLDGSATDHGARVDALLASQDLSAHNRALITDLDNWLGQHEEKLNLAEFCRGTGRNYEATKKALRRIGAREQPPDW